jgi:hypothetical protein
MGGTVQKDEAEDMEHPEQKTDGTVHALEEAGRYVLMSGRQPKQTWLSLVEKRSERTGH